MKTVGFIPIKLNNERTPGKNIRKFKNGIPLVHYIEHALLDAKEVDESYIYCSNDEIKGYAIDGVGCIKRDGKFDGANADVNEMFRVFAETVAADIYVLAHATAPFQTSESIDKAVRAVKSGGYDSALAVKKHQDFLWLDGKPFNYDTKHIPRTQDLNPFYIETTGLYVFTREVILNRKSRIGERPFLLEVSDLEAVDINYPIDFEIADALSGTVYKPVWGGVKRCVIDNGGLTIFVARAHDCKFSALNFQLEFGRAA